jgi:AhpD family alkylhydroperoxidase
VAANITPGFQKRIYSPKSFQSDLQAVLENMDMFRAARRSRRVDSSFAERIMLAVTQVNGCRYCAFGHARAALQAGVDQEEISQLLSGEWETLPPDQVPALLFAQHYAETAGNPDPQTWEHLVTLYGEPTAQDILANIRMITMGNLLGNTFDALLSRFKGRPAAGSSFWKEVLVLLGIFTIPFHLFTLRRHEKTSRSAR